MKQTIFLSFVIAFFIVSCGRQTVPQQTITHPKIAPDRVQKPQYVQKATIIDSASSQRTIADSYNNPNANTSATTDAVSNTASSATVVIDSHGALLVNAASLPANVSHNLDSLNQATRAFTPEQAKNLAYRFNVIPPRVLLVPDNLVKKGVKGYYYKYQNKFWYWKKDDGYFYLDENYYK